MYSAVLVADAAAAGWQPLPPPPAETSVDFRSAAYAIEWWLFGGFAVFIAVRWIRDNGREPTGAALGRDSAPAKEDADL